VPHRVKLSRLPGWRKPPNTRAVTRSTRFGNPFTVVKPVRDAGRSWRVVWSYPGAGRGRQAPPGFEPIKCETRHQAHEQAVRLFREWLTAPEQTDLLDQARHELVGLNLACWCWLNLPCHADVLLDLVNRRGREGVPQ
jgi:hypothetical protein